MLRYIIGNQKSYDEVNSVEENFDQKNSDEKKSDEKKKSTHIVNLTFKAYNKSW